MTDATHPFRDHPAARAFISTAQRYCLLLEHPVRDRDAWLADLLATLSTLYAAAPILREFGTPGEDKDLPANFKLTNDDWHALYRHLQAVLGNDAHYVAFFNPVQADPLKDRPTQGDLADDLADIYRDLKPGLTAWNTGDDAFLHHILFDWLEIGYRHHWGRHAVDALRALHWIVYR
jgi:hypothetical protein